MRRETETIINIVFLIVLIIAIFDFLYRDYIYQDKTKNELNKFIEKNLNDKYTLFYTNLCKDLTPNDVNCVMTITSPIYHYTKDQNRTTLRTPSQYALLGGNCKDSAILYATIFKKLNYTINFEFPIPSHIALIISKKIDNHTYKYCDIEGNQATCYEVII